jgi:hypothetical protein
MQEFETYNIKGELFLNKFIKNVIELLNSNKKIIKISEIKQ